MEEFDFDSALAAARNLMWASRTLRERANVAGVQVAPANFYSSIPSIPEVLASFEYGTETPPYLDEAIFREDLMLAELDSLVDFAAEFDPPKEGDQDACERYFWSNSQFSYSDAMAYYAYLRRVRPANVVEIGSGFSTLVALEALARNGSGTVHCIEPFPRPFIRQLADAGKLVLHDVTAQKVEPAGLNEILSDGDVLFIDSTHTVKAGSDCLHIYLRLLPKLRRRLYVHVHDVFLPFAMPQEWLLDLHIYWTEQYLLLALLTDNPRARVLFGSTYFQQLHPQRLERLMHGRNIAGGGSLWFEYAAPGQSPGQVG